MGVGLVREITCSFLDSSNAITSHPLPSRTNRLRNRDRDLTDEFIISIEIVITPGVYIY